MRTFDVPMISRRLQKFISNSDDRAAGGEENEKILEFVFNTSSLEGTVIWIPKFTVQKWFYFQSVDRKIQYRLAIFFFSS